MIRRLLRGASAAAVITIAAPGLAADDHARPLLVTEADVLIPGKTANIGIAFEIDDQWHLYWNGRNDTGFEPEIHLTLPPGYEAGKVLWPAPKRKISEGDILDHIYEERLLLTIPLKVPADAEPGSDVKIDAQLEWLVCKEACIPGSAALTRVLRVGSASRQPQPTRDAPLFEQAKRRHPRPLPKEDPPVVLSPGEENTFIISAPRAGKIAFYPARESTRLAHPIADAAADSSSLRLRLEDSDKPVRIVGIVEIWPHPKAPAGTASVWWVDSRPASKDKAPVPIDPDPSNKSPSEDP